jgi:hypothetical protein
VSRVPLIAGIVWTLIDLCVGCATAWGTPLFGEPRWYPVGTSPLALVKGEFNGQPGTDVATANEGNTVTILTNLGNGTFQAERLGNIEIEDRYTTTGFAAGSFNADAITDFALSADDNESFPDFSGAIVYYRSAAVGSFRYSRVAVAAGLFPTCITAGDLTGNGLDDLAACGTDTSGAGLISVLRRTSPTAFAQAVENISTGAIIANRLVVADVDADGRNDLLVIDTDANSVYVMYGRSSGALFDTPVLVASVNAPTAVVAAQFTDDGLPDLVITSRDTARAVSSRQTSPRNFAAGVPFQVGIRPLDLAAADFTRDGAADVVVVNNGSNDVTLLIGNGNGTFTIGETVSVGRGPVAIVAADFNGDGKPDFATADQDDVSFGADIQRVSVVLNGVSPALTPTPSPTPTNTPRRTFTPTPSPTPAGPGDVNCDGRQNADDIATIVHRIFDGTSGCISRAVTARDITLTVQQIFF